MKNTTWKSCIRREECQLTWLQNVWKLVLLFLRCRRRRRRRTLSIELSWSLRMVTDCLTFLHQKNKTKIYFFSSLFYVVAVFELFSSSIFDRLKWRRNLYFRNERSSHKLCQPACESTKALSIGWTVELQLNENVEYCPRRASVCVCAVCCVRWIQRKRPSKKATIIAHNTV